MKKKKKQKKMKKKEEKSEKKRRKKWRKKMKKKNEKKHTPEERAGNPNFRLRLRAPEGKNPLRETSFPVKTPKKGEKPHLVTFGHFR